MSFEIPWYMKPFEEAIKNMDNSANVLPQDGEEMTETYNTSGVPVDYQDRMAQRMVGYDYQNAHDNGYLEGLAAGIDQGKRDTIDRVLEIIEGFVEQMIYATGSVEYYIDDVDGLIDAVLALKGEQE